MDLWERDRVKTGDCPFLLQNKEKMLKNKKKNKKNVKVSRKRAAGSLKRSNKRKTELAMPLTLGNLSRDRSMVLIPVLLFIFSITMAAAFYFVAKHEKEPVTVVEEKRNIALEMEIRKLVDGYPIEKMTPHIAMQDPQVAAFLVSIAKKESNWGKRKPVLDGKDCYNYWGFRLKTEKMGSGGHSCFNSPKEAVEIVAARIGEMINEEKLDTPNKMVVWKCGYGGCQNDSSEQKWIRDITFYYNKLSDYL